MFRRILRITLTALLFVACFNPISTALAAQGAPVGGSGLETGFGGEKDAATGSGTSGDEQLPSDLEEDTSGSGTVSMEEPDSDSFSDEEGITTETEIFDVEPLEGDSQEDSDTSEPTPVRYDTPLAEGTYIIRPTMSDNRVLDISGGSTANGANLQLYNSNMGMNQRFVVSFDNATGFYTIQSVYSGKALDVQWGIAASGTNVSQYETHGGANQQWVIVKDENRPGAYRIISALSPKANTGELNTGGSSAGETSFSPELVLDVAGGANADCANILLYESNGAAWQSFVFLPETPSVAPSTASIPNGHYKIISSLPGGMALDIPAASEANGVPLTIYASSDSAAQVFDIKRDGDYYSIRLVASGAALDIPVGNVVAGVNVIQYANSNSDNQRWAIYESSTPGAYTFVSKVSGLALDVPGGSTAPGTPLLQWYQKDNAPNQMFSLEAASDVVISAEYVSIVPYSQRGKALDVPGNSSLPGTSLQVYAANSSLAQRFRVENVGPNTYAFWCTVSGCYVTAHNADITQELGEGGLPKDTQKWTISRDFGGYIFTNVATGEVLELTSGGMDGHDVKTANYVSGNTAQIFRIVGATITIPEGCYVINNSFNFRLDINGGAAANGTNIHTYYPNDTSAQKYELQHIGWGYYSVKSAAAPNRVLDIYGSSVTDGANVQLWEYNGGANQLWRLIPTGDGWYYLQSQSNMYLASDNGASNFGNIFVEGQVTANTQKFRFEPTVYAPPTPYQGTFADVNLSTQRMMFVKDGWPVLECDIVSGAPWMGTPTGTFYVMYKTRNAILRGPGYATPVSFWMPFTVQGHGFHDATWQPWFGGNRYLTNGSHGCVNMPYWAAQELYYWISPGDEVRIHW